MSGMHLTNEFKSSTANATRTVLTRRYIMPRRAPKLLAQTGSFDAAASVKDGIPVVGTVGPARGKRSNSVAKALWRGSKVLAIS